MDKRDNQGQIDLIMQDLDYEYNVFKVHKERYDKKRHEAETELLALAQFKEGDKVLWRVSEQDIPAIVRGVFTYQRRGYTSINGMGIYYDLAKVTGEGKAHRTQNVNYTRVPESEIEGVE